MGVYDTVFVPCPKCGQLYEAQSKSGRCLLNEYSFVDAPEDVLWGVCLGALYTPLTCECGTKFMVAPNRTVHIIDSDPSA
jgi:hypothetical protein